jgi:hypothetical protein
MASMKDSFFAYAAAFEQTYADDDWERLSWQVECQPRSRWTAFSAVCSVEKPDFQGRPPSSAPP